MPKLRSISKPHLPCISCQSFVCLPRPIHVGDLGLWECCRGGRGLRPSARTCLVRLCSSCYVGLHACCLLFSCRGPLLALALASGVFLGASSL